jgi:acetyltransferase-like isoleucine patch superfamily enzyme
MDIIIRSTGEWCRFIESAIATPFVWVMSHTGMREVDISDIIVIPESFIDPDVFIVQEPKLGKPVRIDDGFHCTTQLELGDFVHISPYVTCIGGGESKFICKGFNNIMAGARIICASDRFDDSGLFGALIPDELKGKHINEPVIVDEFANVGTNAVMMPGSRLRKGALLTIGSVLFGDTEEWGVYKGNPANCVRKIDGSEIMRRAKKLGYEL